MTGRLGGRGKKPEPKSGTARKGDAARSELCPRVLRARENAGRPLCSDRGSQRKHLELAKKAAEAALRVRPDLGETHLALARYYFCASFSATGAPIYAGNFDRARDELTIARRKLPNNPEALLIAARIDRHQNVGTLRWPIFKRQTTSTHATVRSHSGSGRLILRCAATTSGNNS